MHAPSVIRVCSCMCAYGRKNLYIDIMYILLIYVKGFYIGRNCDVFMGGIVMCSHVFMHECSCICVYMCVGMYVYIYIYINCI